MDQPSTTNGVPVGENWVNLSTEDKYLLDTMRKAGVFETKNGSVILHFNYEGRLMKIDRQQILFINRLDKLQG